MEVMFPVPVMKRSEAKDVACPKCGAPKGERCVTLYDVNIPYHVERGRQARWAANGISVPDSGDD